MYNRVNNFSRMNINIYTNRNYKKEFEIKITNKNYNQNTKNKLQYILRLQLK